MTDEYKKLLQVGLTDQQVEQSKQAHGLNKIDEAEPPTFWAEFIGNFDDPMIKILCAISILMLALFVLGLVGIVPEGSVEWYEPTMTLIAVFIVNFISARTSMASDGAYRKLKDSTKKDTVKVKRNGAIEVIEVDNIVVGDVVVLQSGDKIPADGILAQGELRVDNSALNGEAEECKKTEAPEEFSIPDEITGDTFVDEHSLFKGAIVFSGEALMIVQKVGMKTMMGKMAADMADDEVDSPLKVKLAKLAEQISAFGYIGAVVISVAYLIHYIFMAGGVTAWLGGKEVSPILYIAAVVVGALVGFLWIKRPKKVDGSDDSESSSGVKGLVIAMALGVALCVAGVWVYTGGIEVFQSIVRAVMVAIVIIVCAVPEGLPLMISLVLMQNTGRLLEHQCLVRKPVGIETAGGVKILFSDKTGTITKGKLEVVNVIDGNGIDVSDTKGGDILKQIHIAIARNTGSMFDGEGNVIGGNATDQCLLRFLGKEVFDKLQGDESCVITESQGFNSANKFSQSRLEKLGKTFYKGAPERILAKAKKYIDEKGNIRDIDLEALNKRIDALSDKAMRVLAFGYSPSKMVENNINDDVVLIGLVGIRDDVRPEAKTAIEKVQNAGIQVVMITGDRLGTAVAIAKDAGLLTGNIHVVTVNDDLDHIETVTKDSDTIALTSDVLNKLSDDAVKSVLTKIRVIARALPTDKSRMAKLCQEMNLVCGMCGDGVNDSPALKRADVGFAMGSGTEAAKEAGDIVILDDNFQSIKDAIWYGRTIFHNILKFCKVQLSINVGAVLLSAIGPFIGIEEPLTVVQLLFVNLCMDGLASIMLGNEPALERYMDEKPRERDESIISKPMFIQFTFMGIYLMCMSLLICKVPAIAAYVGTPEQAKTAIFPLFIFTAMFNVFNCRAENLNLFYRIKENDKFFPVWIAILVITVLITQFGGVPLGCVPLGFNAWVIVIMVALGGIAIDMVRKIITKSIVGSYI